MRCLECLKVYDAGRPIEMAWCADDINYHRNDNHCQWTYPRKINKPGLEHFEMHLLKHHFYVGCAREHFVMNSPDRIAPFASSIPEQCHSELHSNCDHFFD